MTFQQRIHKLLDHGDFDPELIAAILDLPVADVHHALRDDTFEPSLPTADPHVVGEVWSNAGVLTVSAG